MGVFVFLPLVLPLTAWPVARLAAQHLHPRTATRMLSVVAGVSAVSSTLCLGLLVVVGTAQVPGNPLPDGWSDEEVRRAVPHDEVAGKVAIPLLLVALVGCVRLVRRHRRVRREVGRALSPVRGRSVAVLADGEPYAYAWPGGPGGHRAGGRVVVSAGMLARLDGAERRVLFAHERAHLAGAHHRYLLTVELASRATPFLRPLRSAVAFTVERWADEEAARVVGSRRVVARAVGKAALVSGAAPVALAGLATPGPVPRRVAALLEPAPAARSWPSLFSRVGLATWAAAVGATASALSSANAAVTLFLVLKAATPL